MTQRRKLVLIMVLTPIILIAALWVSAFIYQFSNMRTAAPDGKGRTAADYEAGRTVTCVTVQFVKGGWSYPCTPGQQIRKAIENANFDMSLIFLLAI